MIFAVLNTMPEGETRLSAAIADIFPHAHLQLAPGQWLIALKGKATAQEISDQLGISAGLTFAVVVSVSGFWGWQPNNIWEWITANWGDA